MRGLDRLRGGPGGGAHPRRGVAAARDEHRSPRQAGTPGCDWPWRSAYVTHDGKVQPCCMVMGADRAMLGDLNTEDFPAIWRGTAYAEFRDGLLTDNAPPAVCRGCSMYRGIF